MTPLDHAHAAMTAAPDDDAARLAFFGRLADAELFVLLEREAEGEDIAPDLYAVEEGQFALVFDLPERLAEFTGRPAPYAALPGRVLARMLAGHDIGLALNPGVAPSEMLLAAEGVDWLVDMLAQVPVAREGRPLRFHPPDGMPEGLFDVLDAKLATAGGLAQTAWLCAADWADGTRGLTLTFVGTAPGAEGALAQAVAEALAFSGLGSGWLDVLFVAPGESTAQAVERVGLGFILPVPDAPEDAAPQPPGMDPDRPPRLR